MALIGHLSSPSLVFSSHLLSLSILVDCIRSDLHIDSLQTEFRALLTLLDGLHDDVKRRSVPLTHVWELITSLRERTSLDLAPTADNDSVMAGQPPLDTENAAWIKDAMKHLKKPQDKNQ